MGKLVIPNNQILSIFRLESGNLIIHVDRTVNRLIERIKVLEGE